MNRNIVSSIFEKENDLRPYADVTIFGESVSGLLDTGASISCIGGSFAAKFLDSNHPYKKLNSKVHTADGKPQNIVGFVRTNIIFRSLEKPIEIYIIPSLSQQLYLGVDFWRSFDLLPFHFVNSPSTPSIAAIRETCSLSSHQKQKLNKVIELFPSFAKEGLGKTTFVSHVIDVGEARPIKQRHYPVSPAIEKLMYEEVNRMQELGIIEALLASW